jgi:hypothetical protein
VTTLAVVVTVDPELQTALQLLGRQQGLGVVIEIKFVLKGGEEALHHRVVPAVALGRHTATDLVALQKLPVGGSSVLAP